MAYKTKNRSSNSTKYNRIPEELREEEFNEFILPHLTKGTRGPDKKISFFKLFNYILQFMHTGCQWKKLAIDLDAHGEPEIHGFVE